MGQVKPVNTPQVSLIRGYLQRYTKEKIAKTRGISILEFINEEEKAKLAFKN